MSTILRLNGTLLAITVLAALPMAGAGPALAGSVPAAKTWTVKPGGTFKGASTAGLKITDVTSKLTITCKPAGIGGTLKSGSGLPAGIGTVTSFTINQTSCTVGSGLIAPGLRDAAALKWPLTAASYNATTGVTSGTISHIHIAAGAGTCSVIVDGTSASANNGTVKITYTNKTHQLAILPSGGNLHLYKPTSGCGGVVKNGDAITLSATYIVTPAQTITSP